MIEVLWIDDEYGDPAMIQFSIDAENNGINLNGYESFEEGFAELQANMEKYDVILLDGLFFEKKDQIKGTEDIDGLGSAIAKINELKSKKPFPWFVLSGKDQFTKGENPLLVANKAELFDKTNPSDVSKLFEVINKSASENEEFKLKHKYAELFNLCEDKYLGNDQLERLMNLIKHIEGVKLLSTTEDQLNPLRKIVEIIFHKFKAYNIVPPEIKETNRISLFLSNRHNDFKHEKAFIEPTVAELFFRLLTITQDGSHSEGDLRLQVDNFLKSNKSGFLFNSCVFQLFEIMIWFGKVIDQYPDPEVNKSLWSVIPKNVSQWISGSVLRIADNGWGTFKPTNSHNTISIPPPIVASNNLKNGMAIKITTKPSPDGSKIFIDQLSII